MLSTRSAINSLAKKNYSGREKKSEIILIKRKKVYFKTFALLFNKYNSYDYKN